jgi:transposase-like protein
LGLSHDTRSSTAQATGGLGLPRYRRYACPFRAWILAFNKIKGEWKYLYRAVDKAGDRVDFLFRAKRDKAAARRYFEKAIAGNGVPETVTTDKSGANLAGLNAINADREMPIKIRQSKYLNNVVEQDHRAIKRIVRPMLGFKSFRCARVILGGIELMHMIAKGQMKSDGGRHRSVAEQFYDLLNKHSSRFRPDSS